MTQDSPKARRDFRETLKMANLGNAAAQYELALMYAHGIGTERNSELALGWLRRAAERGLAAAQYLLGSSYEQGIDLPPSPIEAARWYWRAAQQGHLKSLLRIGRQFSKGHEDLALAHIRLAAEGGLAEAQYELARRLSRNLGGPPGAEAWDWMGRAAEAGYPAAQCALGQWYAQGDGVDRDTRMARRWLRKAARQNFPEAQLALELLDQQENRYGAGSGRSGRNKVPRDRRQNKDRWELVEQSGDAGSRYHLARMFKMGMGAPKDTQRAARLMEMAARQGDMRAEYEYALLLEESHDPQLADLREYWLQRSAAQGHAPALRKLAQAVLSSASGEAAVQDGKEGAQALARLAQAALSDDPESLEAMASLLGQPQPRLRCALLKEAAARGSAQAQYELGCAWLQSADAAMQSDPMAARAWFDLAAQQGHPLASVELAGMLARGTGGEMDVARAIALLMPLARQGEKRAQWVLGGVYAKGVNPGQPDLQAALDWCAKSAAQGFVPAQATLGNLHAMAGKTAQAVRFWTLAAEAGDPEAQFNLASALQAGSAVPADPAAAARWFRHAASQGLAPAQVQLGICYASGAGVPQDMVQACRWFLAASRLGNVSAQQNLERARRLLSPAQWDEAEQRCSNDH